jgi:hypothetical protein
MCVLMFKNTLETLNITYYSLYWTAARKSFASSQQYMLQCKADEDSDAIEAFIILFTAHYFQLKRFVSI